MTIFKHYAMHTTTHQIEFGIVTSLVHKLARMEGGVVIARTSARRMHSVVPD
jgi:hypothetical protein